MLNISVALTSLVLSVLGIVQAHAIRNQDRQSARKYFLWFFGFYMLYSGSILIGLLYRGSPVAGARTILLISNFCEFLFSPVMAYIMSAYLLELTCPGKTRKRILFVFKILFAVHIILLIISQFSGLYYTIGNDNIYRRGELYPLTYAFAFVMMLIDLVILIYYRRRLTGAEFTAFIIYFLFPFIAMIVQVFLYGFNFVVLATIVAAMTMYLFLVNDQTKRILIQRQENTDLKVDLMLSQIQPHFLFNSLLVIKEVCLTDPEQAASAIDEFAGYLRHNMDSLTNDSPITFTEELEHVKQYLDLQQLRFGRDLDVRYDIGCEGFRLPTLTLQPIVENAVRYGVRKNPDGKGTIYIKTREYDDRYEVSVEDDGPGFVPDALLNDSQRSHVGLRNVKERLARVSRGSLMIDSELGKGTCVRMQIPKTGS